MILRPTALTLTDTLFPSPTLFRSTAVRAGEPAPLVGTALPPEDAGGTGWRSVAVAGRASRRGLVVVPAGRPGIGGRRGTRRVRASGPAPRSEEHTSELQSLMRNSYAVFCLQKKK